MNEEQIHENEMVVDYDFAPTDMEKLWNFEEKWIHSGFYVAVCPSWQICVAEYITLRHKPARKKSI